MLKLSRKRNLRDLGGLKVGDSRMVRLDRIYRSGSLYNLSSSDALKLERSGVSLIIDLRAPLEIEEKPDTPIPGISYVKNPFLMDSTVGITHQSGSDPINIVRNLKNDKDALLQLLPDMEALYLKMVSDPDIQKQIGTALNLIMQQVLVDKKVLFHCTAGKDRTGILSAVILNLLGVDRNEILKDYIKTNRSAYTGAVKKGLLVGALTHSFNMGLSAYQLFMAQQRHLIKTMSVIRKHYESVDKFVIEELGCNPEIVDAFKAKMLIPYHTVKKRFIFF